MKRGKIKVSQNFLCVIARQKCDSSLNIFYRKMVWTDWGASPKLEIAGMDGSNRTTIVSERVTWPNDITIDHATGRLVYK